MLMTTPDALGVDLIDALEGMCELIPAGLAVTDDSQDSVGLRGEQRTIRDGSRGGASSRTMS